MKKTATLYLPKKGKEIWTSIMEGRSDISEDIYECQPIVQATSRFRDGIQVVGGVYKSPQPEEYNIKFYYVFDKKGNMLPHRIDPSDHEDFRENIIVFYLNEEEVGDKYILYIKERK